MIRSALFSLFVSASFVPVAGLAAEVESPIFKYQGREFSPKDFPAKLQQGLYEIESQRFQAIEQIVDGVLVEQYVADQVKKTGKSKDVVEAGLFPTKEPTDKEVKTWYESNKERLPPGYQLEQIKNDIKTLLKTEKQEE